MAVALRTLFKFGPILFAFGFLAPLIAQIVQALEVTPPFGASPLMSGLIIAGTLGLAAQVRGRWI
ncbi:hypothetical protein [Henriciella marina]|uniref:hypothetical protein n=1 Tax=Henriciella marina TaxID=453851 RepID=UPI00035DF646|nr:hypothetical protein [Henriciella marina]